MLGPHGRAHRATVKPLTKVNDGFWGTHISGAGFPRAEVSGLSSVGGGVDVRTSSTLSVPRMRPDFTYRMFSTKLRVIVHNFTHQLFDQLLADQAVLAAS